MSIVYFFIAIFTTTLGALTGMGGGVIIKPVLDILGHFDTQTIGILSSVSVFAMAIVSIAKQFMAKAKVEPKIVVPLALGSIVGGSAGQSMLDSVIANTNSANFIIILQNILLGILILVVFTYMLNKSKIPGKHLSGIIPSALVGIFLGIVSSFLGIGGGPINVAIFMYLFSYDTKTAALSSIVTILFAQISKLSSVLLTTGFAIYDLSVLPFMVVGAIMGGFIGSKLSLKFSSEQIDKAFNGVQLLVLLICIVNIISNV